MREEELHNLSEYINALQGEGLIVSSHITGSALEKRVRHLTYDSQDMKFQTLFVCKGAHFKEEYLYYALENGAFVYISEKEYPVSEGDGGQGISNIIVSDIRKAMAVLADMFYNHIWDQLIISGITGTKGKSSTAYFMRSILDDYLKDIKRPASAIISSIENYDGITCEEAHMTTPEAMVFHRHMYNMVKSGIEYLTMEVSSQALKYHRTTNVIFDVGCFLNLGIDHISDVEHPNFQDYGDSKKLLFNRCKTAVVNLDSDFAGEVIEAAKTGSMTEKILTFGVEGAGDNEKADFWAYDIVPLGKSISFRVKCDSFDRQLVINMAGLFNVSNALAAVSMAYALHIPFKNIREGLKKAKVNGRMEVFTDNKEEVTVIVDYAHNKMSFVTLFESLKKEYPGKKLVIIYGCVGGKAMGRRKDMGEISGKYADLSIITEDHAGEEDLLKICDEVASYVKAQGGIYKIIPNREEAVTQAIMDADARTVIIVAGKGRESCQKRGVVYVDTPTDVDYVQRALAMRG